MSVLVAERTASDVPMEILVTDAGGGVTGLTMLASVRDPASGEYLDFSDGLFKAAGWTTRQVAVAEVDVTNEPGQYGGVTLDLGAINNMPANLNTLIIRYDGSGPAVAVGFDTIQLTEYTRQRAVGLDYLKYLNKGQFAIHFDSGAANANTVVGVDGTIDNPVSTEAALLTLGSALGIRTYHISGALILSAPFTQSRFITNRMLPGSIFLSGQDVSSSRFEDVAVIGAGTGTIDADRVLFSSVSGLTGTLQDCLLHTSVGFSGAPPILIKCVSVASASLPTELDLSGLSGEMSIRNLIGDVKITNVGAGLDLQITDMLGRVELDATCTAGSIYLTGIGNLTDASGGGCAVTSSGFISAGSLSTTELDEIHEFFGLNASFPTTHIPGQISSTNITVDVDTVGSTVVKTRV